jgi:hypothetical protein
MAIEPKQAGNFTSRRMGIGFEGLNRRLYRKLAILISAALQNFKKSFRSGFSPPLTFFNSTYFSNVEFSRLLRIGLAQLVLVSRFL